MIWKIKWVESYEDEHAQKVFKMLKWPHYKNGDEMQKNLIIKRLKNFV
jgi:hypothetical protein